MDHIILYDDFSPKTLRSTFDPDGRWHFYGLHTKKKPFGLRMGLLSGVCHCGQDGYNTPDKIITGYGLHSKSKMDPQHNRIVMQKRRIKKSKKTVQHIHSFLYSTTSLFTTKIPFWGQNIIKIFVFSSILKTPDAGI